MGRSWLIVCVWLVFSVGGYASGVSTPLSPPDLDAEPSRSAVPSYFAGACPEVLVCSLASGQTPAKQPTSYFAWVGAGADTIVIQANVIEQVGDIVTASGSVRFTNGPRVVLADKVVLDTVKQSAVFTEVAATTCERATPHYQVRLGRLTLMGTGEVRGVGVSLYLHGRRVLYLPSIRLRLSPDRTTRQAFPRPGYDKADGITLSQSFDLADTDRFRAIADIRLTSKRGIQGSLDSQYGVDKKLGAIPGRVLSYESMFSDLLDIPKSVAECLCGPEDRTPPDFARVVAFGVLSLKQRSTDPQNAGLIVYRRPEVGVKYTARQLSISGRELDRRLEILPEVRASYGRIWEKDGQVGAKTRRSFGLGGGVDLIDLGPKTSVQPVFYLNWSGYSGGDSLRIGSYGLDASHIWGANSFVSGRYVKRSSKGFTPFEFDDVDIASEFQGAVQFDSGSHTFGFLAGYDLDRKYLHDWEAQYGYRTDCTATRFTWNGRLKRFGFEVRLLAL